MTDRETVALAMYAFVGAWLAVGPPPWTGAAAVVVALLVRRPWLLCLAVAVLAGGLAARSLHGLNPPATGSFAGVATLVADPVGRDDTMRVTVRVDGNHLDARATGDAAAALADRLAGEHVTIEGSIEALRQRSPWHDSRHIAGHLTIDAVTAHAPGPPAVRAANNLRRTFERGAAVLAPDRRALFLGVVLGDDRDVAATVADDFRRAGLSHLMVVSGMNVALVLTIAGPLLCRFRTVGRLTATVAVIAFFALLTRFEPSVLRASAMAAIAALAFALGRPASGLRCLSLAVTALVLVDPLLVRAVGFQLSAAASAGILVLAGPIRALLRGPRPLADAAAVTVAAQLGVSPLLVATFDGVPLASLPANLLAVPAATLVRVWGMTAGVIAGWASDAGLAPVARLLHVPTDLLTGWLELVAGRMASLRLGELGAADLVVVVGGAALLVFAVRWRRHVAAGVAAFTVVVGLIAPGIAGLTPPPPFTQVATGAALWRLDDATVLALDRRVRVDALVSGLGGEGVTDVDLLVVRSDGVDTSSAVAAVTARAAPDLLIAPDAAGVAGATTVAEVSTITIGGAVVTIEPAGAELLVSVAERSSQPPRT